MNSDERVLHVIRFVIALIAVQIVLLLPGLLLLPADPVTMYYYIIVVAVSIVMSYYLSTMKRWSVLAVSVVLWYFVTLIIAAFSYSILLLAFPAPRPFPVLVFATVVGVPISYAILNRYY